MRDHYDFSEMQGRRNPYAGKLKQAVTIRIDRDTVAYFKAMAAKTGLAYQSLVNLYLRECAASGKQLAMRWVAPAAGPAKSRNAGKVPTAGTTKTVARAERKE